MARCRFLGLAVVLAVVAASPGCSGGSGTGSGGASGHVGAAGATGTTGGAGAGGASGHAGTAGTAGSAGAGGASGHAGTAGAAGGAGAGGASGHAGTAGGAGAGGAAGASDLCGGIVPDQSADCGGCISSTYCTTEMACAADPACKQIVETGRGDCSNSNFAILNEVATFECDCAANIFPCQPLPTDASTGGQDASTGHDAGCTEFVGPSSDCEACLETHCCAAAAACSQDTACEQDVQNGAGSSATFATLKSCSNTFSCSGTCAFN